MKQMGQGHKTHYLVKWKGYPTSDNSWEPEKNLNADELVANFKWSFMLHHGRDVHPMWVKLFTRTLSNKGLIVLSTKSKEDLGSF